MTSPQAQGVCTFAVEPMLGCVTRSWPLGLPKCKVVALHIADGELFRVQFGSVPAGQIYIAAQKQASACRRSKMTRRAAKARPIIYNDHDRTGVRSVFVSVSPESPPGPVNQLGQASKGFGGRAIEQVA